MAQVDFSWDCDSSFVDHHKVDDLAEAMGARIADAGWALVRLFCRARRFAPSGDLSGLSDTALANWAGTKRMTMAALVKGGWVDVFDGGTKKLLHGWHERDYVGRDERRKELAIQSKERMNRWRERKKTPQTTRNKTVAVTVERTRNKPCSGDGDVTNVYSDVTDEGEGEGDVDVVPSELKDTAPSPEALRDWWNDLADELRLAHVVTFDGERREIAKRSLKCVWNQRDKIAAALRHPANRWHVETKAATFEWLCQKRRPWLPLIEKAQADSSGALFEPPTDAGRRFLRALAAIAARVQNHQRIRVDGNGPYVAGVFCDQAEARDPATNQRVLDLVALFQDEREPEQAVRERVEVLA